MEHFVYIVASTRGGPLHVGTTTNLVQRVWQHKQHAEDDAVSERHEYTKLVWFEQHATLETAARRCEQIKRASRAWQSHLVEQRNPNWRDMFSEVVG